MTSQSARREPFVYVIDIDGTLVGDVTYEVCEWEILQRYEPKKLKAFRAKLIDHLREGLMRPFISDFLTMMKQANDNTEFFVYTASDDKWAQFFVPCIETACGCKFSRPIFTRKHCLSMDKSLKKSLVKISNQVWTKLKPKYGGSLFKNAAHVSEHMLLIDNNKVLIEKETRKGIICPSYEHNIIYDVLRNIDERVLHENTYGIMQVLAKYSLVDHNKLNNMSGKNNHSVSYALLALYYEAYADHLRVFHRKMDRSSKRDRYWLNLAHMIETLQSKRISKESMIKYINGKLAP